MSGRAHPSIAHRKAAFFDTVFLVTHVQCGTSKHMGGLVGCKQHGTFTWGTQAMDREYDLFEKLPDGSLIWRAVVTGHESAIAKLRELADYTTNEVRVMHMPTKSIVATMNAKIE